MSRFALDTSVIISWLGRRLAPSAEVQTFWKVLTDEDELIGAQLLLPECTSVIRMSLVQGLISRDEANSWLQEVILLPIRMCESDRQFLRALELADRFQQRRAYDMQHLAAAEIEGCELVTMDRGLRHAADELKHPVRFLR